MCLASSIAGRRKAVGASFEFSGDLRWRAKKLEIAIHPWTLEVHRGSLNELPSMSLVVERYPV